MSSFRQILYHIIFRTKNSANTLTLSDSEDLYRYIWGNDYLISSETFTDVQTLGARASRPQSIRRARYPRSQNILKNNELIR
jgi:hypothetical protein